MVAGPRDAGIASSGIARDEWLAAVQASREPLIEDPAILSVPQFAAMMGVAESTARRLLEKMIQSGRAAREKKWIERRNGSRIVVPGYRLVKL